MDERIITLPIKGEIDPKTITGYSYEDAEWYLLQKLKEMYPNHNFKYGKWKFTFYKDSFDLIVDDTYTIQLKYNDPFTQEFCIWVKI